MIHPHASAFKPLYGKSVLVVEDEVLIAMEVEQILLDLGASEVVLATNLDAAMAHVRGTLMHLAVLDVQLGSASCLPIAQALNAQGIGFVLTSGYRDFDGRFAILGAPLLTKPFSPDDLAAALVRILGGGR